MAWGWEHPQWSPSVESRRQFLLKGEGGLEWNGEALQAWLEAGRRSQRARMVISGDRGNDKPKSLVLNPGPAWASITCMMKRNTVKNGE